MNKNKFIPNQPGAETTFELKAYSRTRSSLFEGRWPLEEKTSIDDEKRVHPKLCFVSLIFIFI